MENLLHSGRGMEEMETDHATIPDSSDEWENRGGEILSIPPHDWRKRKRHL